MAMSMEAVEYMPQHCWLAGFRARDLACRKFHSHHYKLSLSKEIKVAEWKKGWRARRQP